VYAQAGYFYDAIDAVSKLIARNPTDAGLRAQRAALLEQVGLAKVAAADRGGAAP
jgi:Flp pilus assembly protein TadD